MNERNVDFNYDKWRFWIFFGAFVALIVLVGVAKQIINLLS